MPLTDSFLFATNTALTIEFGGFEDLTHNTDGSDNPQTLSIIYLGSVNSSRNLKATSNPGVDNITLTPTDILPIWVLSTAYALGDRAQPTTANGYTYEISTSGTSDSTEPASWPTSIGSTVVDGTCVWTCVSTKHSINEIELSLDGSSWNTAGTALSFGNTINGGTSNKKEVHIRMTNGINIVGSDTAFPEIALQLNAVTEY